MEKMMVTNTSPKTPVSANRRPVLIRTFYRTQIGKTITVEPWSALGKQKQIDYSEEQAMMRLKWKEIGLSLPT
jgi:hypothetical protein